MSDLIRRSDAIKAIMETCCYCSENKVLTEIRNLPTIEPKRGEWVVTDEDSWTNGTHALICSECGKGYHLNFERVIGDWNFCPNCGADMRKESE